MDRYSRGKRLLEMSLGKTSINNKQRRLSKSSEKERPQGQVSSGMSILTPHRTEKPTRQEETSSILNISTSQLIELPDNLDLSVSGDDLSLSFSDLPPLSSALKVASFIMNECTDKNCSGDSVVHDMGEDVIDDITFEEAGDISEREDDKMFHYMNLKEHEPVAVKRIDKSKKHVKECDDVPANGCRDVGGTGIVRKEVDEPARADGENVDDDNVVEAVDEPARAVGENVDGDNVVEAVDVPARAVGENVDDDNVVEAVDEPARADGENVDGDNVVEAVDVPAREREDDKMFHYMNLKEHEPVAVKRIDKSKKHVKECDDVPANGCRDVGGTGIVRKEVDEPARADGENVDDDNVVEAVDEPARADGENVDDDNVVEAVGVPARAVGENVDDDNVVEAVGVPARADGENVDGDNVVEAVVGDNVVELVNVSARAVGDNVVEFVNVSARAVGDNVVESVNEPVRRSEEVCQASNARVCKALADHEDAKSTMPQSNTASKLAKKEHKKQNRQFVTSQTQHPEEAQTRAQPSVGLAFVKEFLDRLPKMPSYYCWKDIQKIYLEPMFQSFAYIYRECLKVCDCKGKPKMSRTVFVDEVKASNISLFMPRKDQCDLCCE
ncbi:hypothetical protein EGW08_012713 [Elysia chlorotica]|uniref:Uncharacterized protein n=1 Tax=Elysia chlorotica TaxID=188477 RepID=A0A433TD44_ELYCH|nr:hypothetical protein EGW08_012713 [Elysia chlorotica]